MNNRSRTLYSFICALSIACVATQGMHAAQPANETSSSSPSTLPALTPAQQKKLDAFKKTYSYTSKTPTKKSILDLAVQDNIHPDYIRYGLEGRDCALGWAIESSRNVSLARYLLEHGANPNSIHHDKPILMYVTSMDTADLLLEYKVDIIACQRGLLPTIICDLSKRTPELITCYIKQGVDPDPTGGMETSGIKDSHPMILLSHKGWFDMPEKLCAQYLIEGGTSLSYGEKGEYTTPQILKKKLAECQTNTFDIGWHPHTNRLVHYSKKHQIGAFIAHVKQLADTRRSQIHAVIATHLPVNDDKGRKPLADIVTDYYEPTYEQMENEPIPEDKLGPTPRSGEDHYSWIMLDPL